MSVFVVIILSAVAPFLDGPSIPQADSQPLAVVTPRSAEFSIPVAHEGLWRWSRATTPDNDLEYRWEIGVSTNGAEYTFGFSLFKFPGSAAGVGDLGQLLKVGQASLWRLDANGDGSLVSDAKVSVSARDGGVVIQVTDSATVRMLFADRPSNARVLTRTPDTADSPKEISISYRE